MHPSQPELLYLKQCVKESRDPMDYKEYNDYELLNYIQENQEEALHILYQKYEPLVLKYAKKMYPFVKGAGVEMSDLTQEGLLGLTSAIQNFKDQKDATFYTFASTCIERRIISLLTSTRRLKNKILNDSIPIESFDENGTSYSLEYLLSDDTKNPEKLLLSQEYQNHLFVKAKDLLTPLESSVFELKISGFQYKEIAEILEKDVKTIDNALQRIKHKLRILRN